MAKLSKLDGYDEARAVIEKLDRVTQKKVVLSILRKASRPIVRSAQGKAQTVSVRMAKSIRFRQIRSAKKISGSIKPGGKDAWFAHFVEFGTSGIIKKGGGYKRESDNPAFARWVGKLARGARFRKDQPERPFMRPAIDEQESNTKNIMINSFKNEIQTVIRKFSKK